MDDRSTKATRVTALRQALTLVTGMNTTPFRTWVPVDGYLVERETTKEGARAS